MNIPLLDLQAQDENISSEINAAIAQVVNSKHFIMGPEVQKFESELAEYLNSPFVLGVSSGTDALLLALMALGIGPGDEVITTPFTFFATAGCVSRLGATVKFVDINPLTFNIDPSKIKDAITPRTKAIIPVHLFGQSAEMDGIKAVASKNNLPIIEDVAQSIGAKYRDQQLGTLAEFGTYSFFPAKNLGCYGDGGAICCRDEGAYLKMKSLRGHGSSPTMKYEHKLIGGNFRLDTIQAAILSVKLPYLDVSIKKRRTNGMRYIEAFSKLNTNAAVEVLLPSEAENNFHTFNQFVVRLANRDRYLSLAAERGIASAVYYPIPLHLQECFSSLGYKVGDFPNSERASNEVVALPVYPDLSEEAQEMVVSCVLESQRGQ